MAHATDVATAGGGPPATLPGPVDASWRGECHRRAALVESAAMADETDEMAPNEDDAFFVEVGERMRAARKACGLSMRAVVAQGYVGSQAHLSQLERGQVRASLHTLSRLADCYGVPVRELVPPAPIDREAFLRRVAGLTDDELRTLDVTLNLIEGPLHPERE